MRSSAARHITSILLSDRHFLYVCFAPMASIGVDKVLAKIGISTVPMKRLISIHCACPFPLEFAAFTPVGDMKAAKRAESRALACFRDSRTRGEWVVLGVSQEEKKAFSDRVNAMIQGVTKQSVVWARVTKEELAAEVAKSAKQMG